ncbi:MAG: hypothetical protein E3J41_09725 [Candidatus Cloacimonadota bacterium]|nr:MAG: hypothetical protein E3J41_09725 [Candidatus Cloacimonadota bacterium]
MKRIPLEWQSHTDTTHSVSGIAFPKIKEDYKKGNMRLLRESIWEKTRNDETAATTGESS